MSAKLPISTRLSVSHPMHPTVYFQVDGGCSLHLKRISLLDARLWKGGSTKETLLGWA